MKKLDITVNKYLSNNLLNEKNLKSVVGMPIITTRATKLKDGTKIPPKTRGVVFKDLGDKAMVDVELVKEYDGKAKSFTKRVVMPKKALALG
jgi:hypothetical protein